MARKRKALSKRTRFEVFKRDGFRCVYCGADPVGSMLHVDHVIAGANGGSDDPSNLVTSCQSCNGGKSAVPLEQRKLQPSMSTADAEEHLEQLREHLALQRAIHDAKKQAADLFAAQWEARLGPMSDDMYRRLGGLMTTWPTARLLEALDITSRRLAYPGYPFDSRMALDQAKYFHGVLRRWRNGE